MVVSARGQGIGERRAGPARACESTRSLGEAQGAIDRDHLYRYLTRNSGKA